MPKIGFKCSAKVAEQYEFYTSDTNEDLPLSGTADEQVINMRHNKRLGNWLLLHVATQ